jgi:hypothetical protein
MNIETLKEDLAAEHARYKTELERDTLKLIALARLIDAEMAVRELEESRHD